MGKVLSNGLRILSYNIHQGITVTRNRLTLSSLRAAVLALKADIVVLQEVAGSGLQKDMEIAKSRPSETRHQLEDLADSMWPHSAYARNAIFTESFHGNAILSRFPIVNWQNYDISVGQLEKRGILHAEIEVPFLKESFPSLHVLGVHLGLRQRERNKQIQLMCEYVLNKLDFNSPLFIAGDFNDWTHKVSNPLKEHIQLQEAFRKTGARYARTYPSFLPVLSLDRIYFRGSHLLSATCLQGKPWTLFSDHLPVMADFNFG